jgi:hypothetical protein
VRFEVLTAVKTSILVFWVVTPSGFAGRYQRFERTYCLHIQGAEDGESMFFETLVSTPLPPRKPISALNTVFVINSMELATVCFYWQGCFFVRFGWKQVWFDLTSCHKQQLRIAIDFNGSPNKLSGLRVVFAVSSLSSRARRTCSILILRRSARGSRRPPLRSASPSSMTQPAVCTASLASKARR